MYDSRQLRTLLGHYASGLTVVSTLVDNSPVGFTCQSFHSVSMEPPLVSFNVMRSSTSWPIVRDSGKFSINILSKGQSEISSALARSGPEKWKAIAWEPTPAGNPLLEECLAWLDCELFAEHEAGDHMLVVARVVDMQAPDAIPQLPPLIFFKGRYCSLSA